MLLRSLLDTGLLEVVSDEQFPDAGQPYQPLDTANAGFSRRGAPTLRNELDGRVASESSARLENNFRSPRMQAPIPVNIDMSSWDALAQTLDLRDQPSSGSASRVPTVGQFQLREVISLMSDFVMTHLPEQSLAVVLSLEDIKSIEQAIASLQDYEALISPAGEPVRRHLAELRKALATPYLRAALRGLDLILNFTVQEESFNDNSSYLCQRRTAWTSTSSSVSCCKRKPTMSAAT